MGPYSNKHTKIESAISTPSSHTNHVLFMLGSLITTALVTGLCLSSSTTSASTDVIDQVSLTVPIACTMTGTGTTHTATLNPGTYSGASGSEYENGIGKTTLTAICNDDNGFSIYAIGYTGNSYDSENHTKLVGSTTGGTIATKAYASGDTTSNWSMKLTKITDSAESYNPQNLTIQSDTEGTFASWHSVPDTYTKVAEYHANTGSSTTDTTLGVKLETTYAAYIASNQPADTYTGQVKYTLVHPYDHAKPDEFTSETLQSVADWGSKVAPGQTVTVTDARDGQEYTVARLADGKLWMTKNLRLDIGRANITAENTNNPTQAFLTAVSDASSSNEWCTDNNSTCTDQIKYNTSNINNPTTDSEGHKYDEYGVYYNWYTATAGNGTYDTASNTNVSGDICPSGWHLPTGTITSGAPSSWTGEFWNLATALGGGIASDNSNYSDIVGSNGSARMRNNPNSFLYSGHMVGNVISSRGTSGEYFTATKNGSERAYLTTIGSSSIVPGYANALIYFGKTIRCIANAQTHSITVNYGEHVASVSIDGNIVADGDIFDFTEGTSHSVDATFDSGYTIDSWSSTTGVFFDATEQSTSFIMGYTSGILSIATIPMMSINEASILQQVYSCPASLTTGQIYTLADSRDGTEYKVAKLADGKCWIVENLRLDFSSLTSPIHRSNTNNPTLSFINVANNNPASSNSWCTDAYSSSCTDRLHYNTSNIGDDTLDQDGYTHDDYGVYYNWYTATAGNGTYATQNTIAGGDICPKKWHLPTPEEYQSLNSALGGTSSASQNAVQWVSAPASFPRSGLYAISTDPRNTIADQGVYGNYWSSKASNNIYAHYLHIMNTTVSPALGNYLQYKANGLPIRCIFGD